MNSVTTALVLLLAALSLRGFSVNRHVRGRLLLSAMAFAIAALVTLSLRYGMLGRTMNQPAGPVPALLIAFGVINGGVALIINPWRTHGLPERFPTIVQDTIVILMFGLAGAFVLQERVFATTAVGAVVIGFALQDTLGNLFAGLAIQIEKPFRVGQWVRLGGTDGLVSEITWRATKLRTKAGNFMIVPNSALSRDTILNYSEPAVDLRIEVEVGASYDVPPNQVKAAILDAIQDEPLISRSVPSDVLIVDFGDSAVVYRVRVWTTDFTADDRLRDRVRSAIYYSFRRKGIEIPYPTRTQLYRRETERRSDPARAERILQQVSIFSLLTGDERAALAGVVRPCVYGAGEVIVRRGDAGSSMFVLVQGEVVVLLEPDHQEVARVGPGGFFGEMSLLTGDPRNATVRATVDSELLEITAETFREFVLANPAALEQVGQAVATRRAELAEHAAAGGVVAPEPPQRLLDRVRRFLRLSIS